jgi:hypothetical protein
MIPFWYSPTIELIVECVPLLIVIGIVVIIIQYKKWCGYGYYVWKKQRGQG